MKSVAGITLRTIFVVALAIAAGVISQRVAADETSVRMFLRTHCADCHGDDMDSANAHSDKNLPVVLAGGGFRHGQHLAFDVKNNYPLPNLFASMLQRLGIETDQFASSTGIMRGLEMTS